LVQLNGSWFCTNPIGVWNGLKGAWNGWIGVWIHGLDSLRIYCATIFLFITVQQF